MGGQKLYKDHELEAYSQRCQVQGRKQEADPVYQGQNQVSKVCSWDIKSKVRYATSQGQEDGTRDQEAGTRNQKVSTEEQQ